GARAIKRSTLARVNSEQPAQLYEELFGVLYQQCRGLAPKHRFRFKHPLYSLDASVIDLSLRIFPWAKYLHTKGGMKLHLALDHSKRPAETVLTIQAAMDIRSPGSSAIFHGRSSVIRLTGCSAMRASTYRRYASGSSPLSLAVPTSE